MKERKRREKEREREKEGRKCIELIIQLNGKT